MSWTARRGDIERAFPRVRIDPQMLEPCYNLAPTMAVPAILDAEPGRLTALRWGLVPSWVSDSSAGSKMFNARVETVLEKPAFRDAFAGRRCLVVVDGFYEWKRAGKHRTPMHVVMRDRTPMVLAGLWEEANRHTGGARSVTILTGPPNAVMAPIHDRMPCLLAADSRERWLDAGTPAAQLLAILDPIAPESIESYEVSARVNDVRNDEPSLIQPASAPAAPPSLFDPRM